MSITSLNDNSLHRSYWGGLKLTLLKGLYYAQIEYWNRQLGNLMERLASAQQVELRLLDLPYVCIIHQGHRWQMLPMNWIDVQPPAEYYLPLANSLDAALRQEIQSTGPELDKLKQERHESTSFLTNLFLFEPTSDQLKDVLGDNIYGLIRASAERQPSATNSLHPFSLKTFLSQHEDIVEHMQERMVINLIMSDTFQEAK